MQMSIGYELILWWLKGSKIEIKEKTIFDWPFSMMYDRRGKKRLNVLFACDLINIDDGSILRNESQFVPLESTG